MKSPNGIHWGYTGQVDKRKETIRKGMRGKVIGLCNTIPNKDNETKYARTFLSKREYAKRMLRYRRRAQARLSLFNSCKEKHTTDSFNLYCAGCTVKAPKRNHTASLGWVTERVLWYGEPMGRLTVTWCPTCYREEQNARNKVTS